MDISSYLGEVEVAQEQTEVKPGRYNLEYVNTNDELKAGKNNWVGMQINFKIQNTGVFAPFTVTLAHDNPTNVGYGIKDMGLLAKAAGLTGSIKNTDDLKGKVVSCMLKLNDNGYPEVDSKFGSHWKEAEATPEVSATAPSPVVAPAEVAAPTAVAVDDNIPF